MSLTDVKVQLLSAASNCPILGQFLFMDRPAGAPRPLQNPLASGPRRVTILPMAEKDNQAIVFSFVIPVYNEQEGLEAFYKRLTPVVAKLGDPCEIIFINDGSTDDTAGVIRRLASVDPSIKYIEFSRNFGHQTAVTAGYDFAVGRAVICMDADCQHPPEQVTELVARWREGFEVVNAVPQDAAELAQPKRSMATRLLQLLGLITEAHLEFQTDFRLMDRKAVEAFRMAREHARYVRGLVNWIGFRQITVPYKPERAARSQDGAWRKVSGVRSAGLFNYSNRPLRVAPTVGAVLMAVAMVYAVVALALWPLGRAPEPLVSVAMAIVALFGTQFLLMGLLGEYVGRIFEESKNRPLYVIRETRGFEVHKKEEPLPVPVQQDKPPKRFVLYT